VITLVVCLAVGYVTVGRVVVQLDYSHRELVALSRMSIGITVVMAFVLGSLVVWWLAIARSASSFFASGNVRSSSTSMPSPLVVIALVMIAGLAVFCWAAHKNWRASREMRTGLSSSR